MQVSRVNCRRFPSSPSPSPYRCIYACQNKTKCDSSVSVSPVHNLIFMMQGCKSCNNDSRFCEIEIEFENGEANMLIKKPKLDFPIVLLQETKAI